MTLHTRKVHKPKKINKKDREALDTFKNQLREEYISNITANSGMNPNKLQKLSLSTLKEVAEGITPKANHQEAVKAMTGTSTVKAIRNKRKRRQS